MNGKTIHQIAVGDRAEQVNSITLQNAQDYAKITADNNPIHFDTEEAIASRYGQPVAHGMILAGFVSGVIGAQLPGFGCIYESQTMQFIRPVFYGETITTRVTVIKTIPERNRIVLKTDCINQKNQIVMTGEAIVLPRKEE